MLRYFPPVHSFFIAECNKRSTINLSSLKYCTFYAKLLIKLKVQLSGLQNLRGKIAITCYDSGNKVDIMQNREKPGTI